jgi:hypothetical protein
VLRRVFLGGRAVTVLSGELEKAPANEVDREV